MSLSQAAPAHPAREVRPVEEGGSLVVDHHGYPAGPQCMSSLPRCWSAAAIPHTVASTGPAVGAGTQAERENPAEVARPVPLRIHGVPSLPAAAAAAASRNRG
jgi:hypothetical protein